MYVMSVGFSIWCDFIEKDFLEDEFETLINDGIINGATSNPAIFKNAFLNSSAYKQKIQNLKSLEPKQIYEQLAIQDISNAAEKLECLYKKQDDGFVSIEVDPFLANDTQKTIEEGRRLYKSINKPNVMIKIPATDAGYEAMKVLISEGIAINATLVFSPEQALKCLNALKQGCGMYEAQKPLEPLPKAVISVFVSRFDTKVEKLFAQKNLPFATLGIMNATKIYKLLQDNENIRCLFASTGVKSKELKDDYYISGLLYPNAINTAPLDTIYKFISSDNNEVKAIYSDEEIDSYFANLKANNVDMHSIYTELMNEGMSAFEDAFSQILSSLKG